MPSFRRDPDTGVVDEPGNYAPAAAAFAMHGANSRTNVPDPRRNPEPVETARPPMPRGIRAFRALQNGDRPLNDEEGFAEPPENATAFSWGIGNGGAPQGAGDYNADVAAHQGFDKLPGMPTPEAGVGPKDYGNWSSRVGHFTDPQAHEQHFGSGNVDPRHDSGGYRFTTPRFDVSPQEIHNNPAEPVPMSPQAPYEKPEVWFTQGRKATMPKFLYERPFDQQWSQTMTGDKVRPTSPPNVGGAEIDVTPRASLPLRTTTPEAMPNGAAYGGPAFGANGMAPVGPSPNTWRLQPTGWDEYIVDTGVVQ